MYSCRVNSRCDWVRDVCCKCCVLSVRGLYDELITRPEESYRLLCVVVCYTEISWMRRPWPNGGAFAPKTNKQNYIVPLYWLQTVPERQMILDRMVAVMPWVQCRLTFFMKPVPICCVCSKTLELRHILIGFITNIHVMIFSHTAYISAYKHNDLRTQLRRAGFSKRS